MNWDLVRDWLDNPIFIKHVRSRLRRQPLATGAVVVVVLCLCIVWAGYQLDLFLNGRAFEYLLALQGIILVIMGASQVSAAVGGARLSGILDFHRVSPLAPTELTLGFFFGAPIREYILFACTLPFAALFIAFGVPSFHGFIELMVCLIALAWLFHGLALLNSLIMKGQRSARGAVAVIVFFFLFLFNIVRMGRFIPSVAMFSEDGRLTFFGQSLPWLTVVLLYVASMLFFVFLAARRKMGSERIHPLSKLQAIAAMAVVSVLALGAIWQREEHDALEIAALYALVVTAIPLILMVTPNRPEYSKGLWRALKEGRTNLSWWDDLSLNRIFLAILCAIVLAAGTVAWHDAGAPVIGWQLRSTTSGHFPLAIATGVLVVAYFGLAHQYFALRFGPRGKTYFALFLFLTWILPLVAGSIMEMAAMPSGGDVPAQMIVSLSPIPGIAMTAVSGSEPSPRAAVQGFAITPPLLFTFVFNSLLMSARRRHYRSFLAEAAAVRKSTIAVFEDDPSGSAPSEIPTNNSGPSGECVG
jgi:hypothetical protein